jgi:hypothetical protein
MTDRRSKQFWYAVREELNKNDTARGEAESK